MRHWPAPRERLSARKTRIRVGRLNSGLSAEGDFHSFRPKARARDARNARLGQLYRRVVFKLPIADRKGAKHG